MTKSLDPFQVLVITVCGWMNQQQLELIDYLREENRMLREQLSRRRLRFNDDQRRRFADRAKGLGSKLLREVATIVTRDPVGLASPVDRAENMMAAANGDAAERENRRRSRIWGALSNLGPEVGRGTNAEMLPGMGWSQHRSGSGRPAGRSSSGNNGS